jgi:hypothetical protein
MGLPVVDFKGVDRCAAGQRGGCAGSISVDRCGPRQEGWVRPLLNRCVELETAQLGGDKIDHRGWEVQGNATTPGWTTKLGECAPNCEGIAALLHCHAEPTLSEGVVEGAELEHGRGPFVDRFSARNGKKGLDRSRGRGLVNPSTDP